MNLLEKVGSWFNPKSKIENRKSQEASVPPVGITRDPGYGFRPLTQQSERDLSPISQERMIEIAYWLYRTNPLAEGVLKTTRDFVVGEGIGFEAKNPAVEAVLTKFWDDPVNQMELKLPKKVLELGMYGEQCYPAFTTEFAGNVRLGYVDPANIKEVLADPDNCECLFGVVLKSKGNKKGKRYQILQPGDPQDILSSYALAEYQQLSDGPCFFFNINNVSNATRGISDLLNLADWVDGYEQFLFDRLDMRSLINMFVWDIKFEGLTEDEIKKRLQDMPAHVRGAVFGHNERVTREAVSPDLKADDASKDALEFRKHILGSKGFPLPWFGEGGDVNRATAQEMEPRIIKSLSERQKVVVAIIRTILRYVITAKIQAGELDENVPLFDAEGKKTGEIVPAVDVFSVAAPDISVRDIQRVSSAMNPIAVALLTAETQGWIAKEDAAQIFRNVVTLLGWEPTKGKKADKRGDKENGDGATQDYSEEALGKLRRAYAG